jgi:phosphate transport system permease protein
MSRAAMMGESSPFRPRLARRRRIGLLFATGCLLLSLVALLVLGVLLLRIFQEGWPWVTRTFLTQSPSVLDPMNGGMNSAIWGSTWLICLTTVMSVPTGVGAAIYLQEYTRRNRLTRFIELNIANLAGVPSIVYGILGLALFVRWMQLDRSIISGALTLSLLVLPVIIIAAREAIAAVPDSIRQAAYALGATRWQTIRHHVLPASLPGIMTGVILALSRALGETAPLIMLGALTRVSFSPGGDLSEYPLTPSGLYEWFTTGLTDAFTAMPIQIFNWASQPQKEFSDLAAAGIVVLLAILLSMNALAAGLRAWRQRTRL